MTWLRPRPGGATPRTNSPALIPLTTEYTGDHGKPESRPAWPRLFSCGWAWPFHTQSADKVVYTIPMGRTNIVIDESLIRKARKLTHLRTKRQIVDRALDLLVRSESRKGILKYYGSGIWQGDLQTSRRNGV